MRRLALVALLLVGCGALPVHAQTLALGFKPGDQYRYSVHIAGNFTVSVSSMTQTFKLDMTGHESVAVDSVAGDGTADVTLTMTDTTVKMTITGAQGTTTTTTTTTSSSPQKVRIAPDGRILSVNGVNIGSSSPFGAVLGGGIVFAVLPDNAVKPGDTWSKTYDQTSPSGMSSAHITTKSTYLRDESFHKVNAAVVETKSTIDFTLDLSKLGGMPVPTAQLEAPSGSAFPQVAPTGGMDMKGTVTTDVTSWIDPGAHRVLKSVMSGTFTSTMNISGGASAQPSVQAIGPITVKGTTSLDLEPA